MGSAVWVPSTRKSARAHEGAWQLMWKDARGKRRYLTPEHLRKKGDRKRAEALLHEIEQKVQRQKLGLEALDVNSEGHTVRTAVERHLERRADLASIGTLEGYARKHIYPAPFADQSLEHVARAQVAAFLDGKRGDLSDRTVEYLRQIVFAAVEELRDLELYDGGNPWRPFKRTEARARARTSIPAAFVWKMINRAPPGWRDIFIVAAHMGLRRDEILKLRVRWVDLDAGLVTLPADATKKRKARVIPIHPDCVAAIARRSCNEDLLFPSPRTGKKWVGSKSAAHTRDAALRAGVPVHVAEALVFHSWRHTWRTHAAQCGANPEALHAMGWGTKTGRTDRDVYTHLDPAFLSAELAKLSYPKEKR